MTIETVNHLELTWLKGNLENMGGYTARIYFVQFAHVRLERHKLPLNGAWYYNVRVGGSHGRLCYQGTDIIAALASVHDNNNQGGGR